MFEFDWQTILALLFVAAAALLVVRRAFRLVSGTKNNSCQSCSGKSDAGIRQKTLLQIQSPTVDVDNLNESE